VSGRQAPSSEQLSDLLADWRVHLRAKNRSRGTLDSYEYVALDFCRYLADHTWQTCRTG
jgi:hypothetical protein